MTWTGAELDELIATRRADVEAALRTTQEDLWQALTIEVAEKVAPKAKMTPGDLIVDQLGKIHRLVRFGTALDLRVASVEIEPTDEPGSRVDDSKLGPLLIQARTFRCRIRVNRDIVGSGCLVGPSLVLTAWHVIAVRPPSEAQEPPPLVEVLLADGNILPARLPPAFASTCGEAEYTGEAPRADVDVAGHHDVALLEMTKPAAAHLGYAPLPAATPPPFKPSRVFLFDFPEGQSNGMGLGKVIKIRGVTERWMHDISTDPGSSGGAAFGDTCELLGLHQAKWAGRGRLVPSRLFLDDIRVRVDEDRSPLFLWTLDPSQQGRLVIGRDLFIQGIRAAARPKARIRGVWVQRRDPRSGPTGLQFSYDLLVRLLTRLGPGHRPVRIPFSSTTPDLDADIRERLKSAGLEVLAAQAGAGVEVGQAALEAVLKDRSRLLADAIDSAARARDETLWLFLDNPSITLSNSDRLFLEGFVVAAMSHDRIRLVITGFETWGFAGEQFNSPADADGDRAPGFVMEFLGFFTASDVENTLVNASRDLLGKPPLDAATPARAALGGLTSFGGTYADEALPVVAGRLQLTIDVYRELAELA